MAFLDKAGYLYFQLFGEVIMKNKAIFGHIQRLCMIRIQNIFNKKFINITML